MGVIFHEFFSQAFGFLYFRIVTNFHAPHPSPPKKLLFRISLTPLLAVSLSDNYIHYAGDCSTICHIISIGENAPEQATRRHMHSVYTQTHRNTHSQFSSTNNKNFDFLLQGKLEGTSDALWLNRNVNLHFVFPRVSSVLIQINAAPCGI